MHHYGGVRSPILSQSHAFVMLTDRRLGLFSAELAPAEEPQNLLELGN